MIGLVDTRRGQRGMGYGRVLTKKMMFSSNLSSSRLTRATGSTFGWMSSVLESLLNSFSLLVLVWLLPKMVRSKSI